MGHCVSFCQRTINPKNDVIIEIDDPNSLRKYRISPNYSRVIFLQIRIKKFLAKVHSYKIHNNKLNIANLINSKNNGNSITNTNSQSISIINNFNQNNSNNNINNNCTNNPINNINCLKANNVGSKKNKGKRLFNKGAVDKNNNLPGPYDINIPQLAMGIKGNNILSKDPFNKNTNSNIKKLKMKSVKNIQKVKIKKERSLSSNSGNNISNNQVTNSNNTNIKVLDHTISLKKFSDAKSLGNQSMDLMDLDPREGPMDDKRRKYNTIIQDDFSYKGEWKNGKRDGVGLLVWKDVAKFIGEFRDDRTIGFGKLYHDDGDVYVGYWNNFQAKGIGIYKSRKIKYEGYWDNDKQHGFGIETWGKNNNYTGDYNDGCKNGFGIFKMEDKGIYQGEIQNGNMSGIGVFSFKDKRRYKGEWINNKMDGFGIITWPDGKIFAGEFHENKQEGFGVYYTKKKTFIGFWFCGLLEGEAIIVENGKIKKQYWEDGRLTQNLANEYEIFFEKYVNDILKNKALYSG